MCCNPEMAPLTTSCEDTGFWWYDIYVRDHREGKGGTYRECSNISSIKASHSFVQMRFHWTHDIFGVWVQFTSFAGWRIGHHVTDGYRVWGSHDPRNRLTAEVYCDDLELGDSLSTWYKRLESARERHINSLCITIHIKPRKKREKYMTAIGTQCEWK